MILWLILSSVIAAANSQATIQITILAGGSGIPPPFKNLSLNLCISEVSSDWPNECILQNDFNSVSNNQTFSYTRQLGALLLPTWLKLRATIVRETVGTNETETGYWASLDALAFNGASLHYFINESMALSINVNVSCMRSHSSGLFCQDHGDGSNSTFDQKTWLTVINRLNPLKVIDRMNSFSVHNLDGLEIEETEHTCLLLKAKKISAIRFLPSVKFTFTNFVLTCCMECSVQWGDYEAETATAMSDFYMNSRVAEDELKAYLSDAVRNLSPKFVQASNLIKKMPLQQQH